MTRWKLLFAAIAVAGGLLAAPASAQRSTTVDGLLIHLGIVDALAAEHADARHGVHVGAHGRGMEHILVSIADAKSGKRIGDAKVIIELIDPKGKVQKKNLLPMITSGMPDYSEVFHFGWSGAYKLHVTVLRQESPRPVKASFVVNHFL